MKKRDRRRGKPRFFLETEPAMTFEEIGKELRLPTPTVFWVYKQALRKVRSALGVA